MASHHRRR